MKGGPSSVLLGRVERKSWRTASIGELAMHHLVDKRKDRKECAVSKGPVGTSSYRSS